MFYEQIVGTLDTSTPLKITLASNIFNALLDPILMFTLAMGVTGATLATLLSEVTMEEVVTRCYS